MAVMARREGETALTGRVEMDDAYLGGVRSGKTPFVAAVSTSPEGRPRKLKLAPVKGFEREIARGAKHWLAPGAAVVIRTAWVLEREEAACSHQAIAEGGPHGIVWGTRRRQHQERDHRTYRKLGPDHAGRYLASFAWRYNRRYQLNDPAFRPIAPHETRCPIASSSPLSGISRKIIASGIGAIPVGFAQLGGRLGGTIAMTSSFTNDMPRRASFAATS